MAKQRRYTVINSSWINGIKQQSAGVVRMRTHDGSVYDYYGTKRRANAWIKAGTQPGRGPDSSTSAGKYFHVKGVGNDLIIRIAKKGVYGK